MIAASTAAMDDAQDFTLSQRDDGRKMVAECQLLSIGSRETFVTANARHFVCFSMNCFSLVLSSATSDLDASNKSNMKILTTQRIVDELSTNTVDEQHEGKYLLVPKLILCIPFL